MLRALPLSCFFSKRAKSFWPWRLLRKKRGAASEKAHLRCALPIFLPEVPKRLPPDSLLAFNQACVGSELLYAWKAIDLVDFIEQHEAENLANTGNRLQQVEGMGIVVFGGFEDREFQVFE